MTTTAISREWFTTYCQNAAANVLDRDGKVRFTYEQLSAALNTDDNSQVPNVIMNLHDKIVDLCNMKHGEQDVNNERACVLTLLNIHAAYLMISGLWKTAPVQPQGTDEYGFEIF